MHILTHHNNNIRTMEWLDVILFVLMPVRILLSNKITCTYIRMYVGCLYDNERTKFSTVWLCYYVTATYAFLNGRYASKCRNFYAAIECSFFSIDCAIWNL